MLELNTISQYLVLFILILLVVLIVIRLYKSYTGGGLPKAKLEAEKNRLRREYNKTTDSQEKTEIMNEIKKIDHELFIMTRRGK